jgi:hypothetical protein
MKTKTHLCYVRIRKSSNVKNTRQRAQMQIAKSTEENEIK